MPGMNDGMYFIRGSLMSRASSPAFGSSTIVVSIEAHKAAEGRYEAFVNYGRDRTGVDGSHHMNLMVGTVVREVDLGASWTLFIRLDEPGAPAQGDYDLELEVPRLVYEILEIDRDRHWQFSLHRGAIHVLPSA